MLTHRTNPFSKNCRVEETHKAKEKLQTTPAKKKPEKNDKNENDGEDTL
jgi:hypothetical protein